MRDTARAYLVRWVVLPKAHYPGGNELALVRMFVPPGMGDLTTVDHQDLVRLDRYLRSRPSPIHQIPIAGREIRW